jgi:DNA-binding MarR family transcriptional regulator
MAPAPLDPAPTPLDARPSFLLSQLGRYSAERFAERLRPLGLEPRHFGLLARLAAAEGQSQQRLADTLGIHRNVMVGLVDELERRGLVERRRHPRDRRAHALYPTARARALLGRAERAATENDAAVVAALDPGEQQVLVSLLQRLASRAGLRPGIHPGLQQAQQPEQGPRGPAGAGAGRPQAVARARSRPSRIRSSPSSNSSASS